MWPIRISGGLVVRRHQRGTSLSFRGATDLSVLKIAPDVRTRVGICHFPAEKNNHSLGSTLDVVIKWQSELLLALSDVTCFEAILIQLLREKKLIYYSINPSRTNAGYNLRYHTCLKVEYFRVGRLKEITDVFVVTWMKTKVSGIWLNSVEFYYQLNINITGNKNTN